MQATPKNIGLLRNVIRELFIDALVVPSNFVKESVIRKHIKKSIKENKNISRIVNEEFLNLLRVILAK